MRNTDYNQWKPFPKHDLLQHSFKALKDLIEDLDLEFEDALTASSLP